MNKDTIVGIVGAVILVGAMVGVFMYEGTQASQLGVERFTVNFPNKVGSLADVTGTTDEGQMTAETVEVDVANLTSLEFALEWTDDVGSPDSFTLTVESPDGTITESADGSSGSIQVALDSAKLGQAAPEPQTETGRDAADAAAKAAGKHTGRAGTGTWTVTIEMVAAGDGTCVPNVGCAPNEDDTGNPWTLKVTYTAYEAQLLSSDTVE